MWVGEACSIQSGLPRIVKISGGSCLQRSQSSSVPAPTVGPVKLVWASRSNQQIDRHGLV
jgi:hypothetical protein